MNKHIPVVDLFAGPGGLGEGFTSLNEGEAFKIVVSAEMDKAAHKTLRLRAFYRLLRNSKSPELNQYYKFCAGKEAIPYNDAILSLWEKSGKEAQQLELGVEEDNQKLFKIIEENNLDENVPWVLIGGPPCQAYSLVGRARNKGKSNYKAEDDGRHYLYKEYLKTIQKFKPAVFIMENVKGILSAKVNGEKIFKTILNDLSNPDKALGKTDSGTRYKIFSLSSPVQYEYNQDFSYLDSSKFIIKAEDYGIPQARHRVILFGVRADINAIPPQLKKSSLVSIDEVINELPKIRSKLSKEIDSDFNWSINIKSHIAKLTAELNGIDPKDALAEYLAGLSKQFDGELGLGGLRNMVPSNEIENKYLANWFHDKYLHVILNHESRGHMSTDLRRYLYASSFAKIYGISPKGPTDFKLKSLKPQHENWETGKFSDRFRVQLSGKPATTITSHISKDGHYFIHPDPTQCRSLTVREAARIQTFPDNYFFQGTRTEQFHQVGNAVPPLLARKIAEVALNLLSRP